MRDTLQRLWPEIEWIEDLQLRDQVSQTWIRALDRSPLKPDDLNQIPFTLLIPGCPITFMEHKRCVVHIARDSARAVAPERSPLGVACPMHDQWKPQGSRKCEANRRLIFMPA